jgi:hypothetical protein
MNAIFADTFGVALCRHGFAEVKPRKWVRGDRAPIRELFSVMPLKGACYSPVWGFSLDFVPHLIGSTIRWHRSNKGAILDLRYDPIDYSRDGGEWRPNSLEGLSMARKQADNLTHASLDLALPWFQSVSNESDLVQEFENKKQRAFVRFGFENYLQEPLAYAFTMARVGRLLDAEAEIARWVTRVHRDESVKDALVRLLKR